MLQSDPDFFSAYTLIIASNVEPQLEMDLAEILWKGEQLINNADVSVGKGRWTGCPSYLHSQLWIHWKDRSPAQGALR